MSFSYLHQNWKERKGCEREMHLIQNKSCTKILNNIQVLSARSISEFLLSLVERLLYKVYNFYALSYNRQRSWDFWEVILLSPCAYHRKLFKGYANATWLCLCECMGSCICYTCQVWAWAHMCSLVPTVCWTRLLPVGRSLLYLRAVTCVGEERDVGGCSTQTHE